MVVHLEAFNLNKLTPEEGDKVISRRDSSRGSIPVAFVEPDLIPTPDDINSEEERDKSREDSEEGKSQSEEKSSDESEEESCDESEESR